VKLKHLFIEDSGQATTEYILMLACAVGFFALLYNTLLKPIVLNLKTTLANQVQQALFSGNFHTLNIGH
jgi:hypothetical protein